MILKRLVITFVFVPLIASQEGMRPTRSQTAGLTTRVQATAQRMTEQKLSLLNEIILEAPSLRLAENRALVQALAAELLWTSDERRARSLFDEAATNLGQITAAARDEVERESLVRAYGEVRLEVLQAAARRDLRLARTLMRTTGRPEPGSDVGPDVEMSIAMRMAAEDPEQAAGLAAETLRQGVSGELPELISRLQSRDHQRAAAVLASAVTTKLRSSSLSASPDAVQVALDLLRMGSESATTRVPLLDQQSLRALAEELASESAKSPDDASLLVALEPLLPVMDRYAPARAARVRSRLARLNAAAGEEGDPQVDDKAGGTARRGVTTAAAKEEGENEARKAPAKPATREERVDLLIESAKAEAAKNDKRRAFELLEEAHGLVGGRASNLSQLCKQLQVAAAFAPLDPARSFDIAGAAVDHINELANAAAVVDGFITGAHISRDDELVLTAVSVYLSAFPEEGAEGFALLARTEFDGLRRITDRLQRGELRLMARLLILQSVMARR